MISDDYLNCPICYDLIEPDKNCATLKCRHTFHFHCLLESMTRKNSCPMCRATIPFEVSHCNQRTSRETFQQISNSLASIYNRIEPVENDPENINNNTIFHIRTDLNNLSNNLRFRINYIPFENDDLVPDETSDEDLEDSDEDLPPLIDLEERLQNASNIEIA